MSAGVLSADGYIFSTGGSMSSGGGSFESDPGRSVNYTVGNVLTSGSGSREMPIPAGTTRMANLDDMSPQSSHRLDVAGLDLKPTPMLYSFPVPTVYIEERLPGGEVIMTAAPPPLQYDIYEVEQEEVQGKTWDEAMEAHLKVAEASQQSYVIASQRKRLSIGALGAFTPPSYEYRQPLEPLYSESESGSPTTASPEAQYIAQTVAPGLYRCAPSGNFERVGSKVRCEPERVCQDRAISTATDFRPYKFLGMQSHLCGASPKVPLMYAAPPVRTVSMSTASTMASSEEEEKHHPRHVVGKAPFVRARKRGECEKRMHRGVCFCV